MCCPPLIKLPTEKDYKNIFEKEYCKKPIITFDEIPIWFNKRMFYHAFFKSSKRDKIKDIFSLVRAERIMWIKETLQNHKAIQYQGWDRKKRKYRNVVRIDLIFDDYVVISSIWKLKNGLYKGKFKTAFVADNSIHKIKASPKWVKK